MYFMNHDWEHDEDFIYIMCVIIIMLVCFAIVVWAIALEDFIPDWNQPASPYIFPSTMD